MTLKVINNIECVDIKHEAPRILTITSCDKFLASGTDNYIELSLDNTIYRVVAKDIIKAVENAIR